MTYPYFFIKPDNVTGDKITIKGEDLNHLKDVLRAKKGDLVEVSDNNKYRYKTEILSINKSEAILTVKERKKIRSTIPKLTLFQCILKKNAMEFAIQKTTEIGIDEIVPVFSRRVVMDKRKVKNKVARWQKIAEQSSKQCKRDFISKILTPVNIFDIEVSRYDVFYFPYELYTENSNKRNYPGDLSNFTKSKDIYNVNNIVNNIGYIIGPEGGFEEEEAEFLESRGVIEVSLGKNILRSETSAIYFLSVLDYTVRLHR